MELDYVKTIATLESDIKHLNYNLASMHEALSKIQELVIEQNDLRKDISNLINDYNKSKDTLASLSAKLTVIEGEIQSIKRTVNDLPKTMKVNIFDYLWKYAAVAIGGIITLKVTEMLAGG